MADEGLPGAKRADGQAQHYREAIDKIRQRTEYTSKGLATIGSAAIAAIGYSALVDVFPWTDLYAAYAALVVGVVLMVVAVVRIYSRFDWSTRSVFTSSDLDETCARNGISDSGERGLIEKVYEDAAKPHRLSSLAALEAKAERFERIAERSGEKRAKELRERAAQIFAEVAAAQDRAAALLLRERANRALFGWWTRTPARAWSIRRLWARPGTPVLIVVFIAGWYTTAVGSDALQSERKDQIELAESCAKARATKRIVKDQLPKVCDGEGDAEEEPKTPVAKVAREGSASVIGARDRCLQTAEENEESAAACADLEEAARKALPGSGPAPGSGGG